MSRAHASIFGQIRNAVPCVQAAAHMIQQRGKATVCWFHLQQGRELRLPTRASVIDHELLRRSPRDRLPEIFCDQRTRQIDTRRNTGGGPDTPFFHKNAVWIQTYLRKPASEIGGAAPVSGGAFAIE
jgi:hypothetical protein